MASPIALNEILELAKGYPKAKWLVVSADPAVAEALGRAGAKMASKPTEASGIVLVDTLHRLSTEELTTLAAFLHEGRPFIVSVPNSTHGSLRLAALANQEGNAAALDFDTIVETLQGCGLNIADIAAVGADVLDSETGLDFAGLPQQAFDWLRGQLGATEQRWIVLGVRTDSTDRAPLPSVRPLGGYVRPTSSDDARAVVSERERQATDRAEGAERRVGELEAEISRLGETIRELREAGEAQRAEFAGKVEEIRAQFEESARKAIERRTQESNFARKAELKAAAKTEKQLRAELEAAYGRIAQLEAAGAGAAAVSGGDAEAVEASAGVKARDAEEFALDGAASAEDSDSAAASAGIDNPRTDTGMNPAALAAEDAASGESDPKATGQNAAAEEGDGVGLDPEQGRDRAKRVEADAADSRGEGAASEKGAPFRFGKEAEESGSAEADADSRSRSDMSRDSDEGEHAGPEPETELELDGEPDAETDPEADAERELDGPPAPEAKPEADAASACEADSEQAETFGQSGEAEAEPEPAPAADSAPQAEARSQREEESQPERRSVFGRLFGRR